MFYLLVWGGKLVPTHIALYFTAVMFFCTCLGLDTRMESHQGSLSLHVALAHIYGYGKSAVISYSELQWEGKFSSYVDEQIHP